MGLLGRFVGQEEKEAFEELVLFRDEFSTVRDLYQHGFELACKCLWPLLAAQNTVKRGNPDDFGDIHPKSVPVNKRPKSLDKFDKLSNAYKIAYVAQVPGWESFAVQLDSRRRNTIGHATAHHDLQTGRVVSDKDPAGMTYLEFLSETLGVFEARPGLKSEPRRFIAGLRPAGIRGSKRLALDWSGPGVVSYEAAIIMGVGIERTAVVGMGRICVL